MSMLAKTRMARAARWSAVPLIAAGAVALAAGPALAEGTAVGITTYSGYVSAGQLNVSGAYQCTPDTPYDNLEVTAVQQSPDGPVSSTAYLQMPCTGTTLTWQATLTPDQEDAWFTDTDTRVHVTLWAPDDWDSRATTSMNLWA